MMITLGISTLLGLAIVLLALGSRSWMTRRYQRDVEWITQTSLRFSPNAVDAHRWALVYYGVFAALLAGLVLLVPSLVVALLIWVCLLMLPRVLVEYLWKKRRNEIDQQLPAAIATMSNSMRAGLTLVQAIQRLAEQAPEPIRTEFRVMSNRYAYGVNLERTIREAKERLRLPNFNIFASALLLNREMGGDISETLSRISQSLDKLQQMRKTVEAHTSEGRTNIKVLLAAPAVLLLMISTVDSDGVKALFTTPQGFGILLVAGALMAAGIFMAARITRTEV